MELPSALFSLYFRKWNFLALILKNFRQWKPQKISYTSGNKNLEKISYIFSKESFFKFQETKTPPPPKKIFYISGNKNPRNLLMFLGVTFLARKVKKKHF